MAFEEYWNETHRKYATDKPVYDDWLDKHLDIIKQAKGPVLDLGCGLGNDSLYLTERGVSVIASDYSQEALDSIRKSMPEVEVARADISKKLPFEDGQFEVIVADLSLHYFSSETTCNVMREVKRILANGGHVFARVNSVEDLNYGAGQGKRLEENFYFVDGYEKRFFSLSDVEKYFSIIGKVSASNADMTRYSKPKRVIEVMVTK